MAETRRGPSTRRTIGIAQVLLVLAAVALWGASRLTWVVIRSFDGLGPPKDVALSGGIWSTALLPLAVVNLAAAVAVLAVRGWPLRMLSAFLAAASFAIGYLGVSLWAVPDVAARGADLAHVPMATLVGSSRQCWGAGVSVAAAACTVIAAAILMRSASAADSARSGSTKYLAPAARRSKVRGESADNADSAGSGGQQRPHHEDQMLSERMIWDELDEGRDPTDRVHDSDSEGR